MRMSFASGSVVEAWVSFVCLSPLKSIHVLPPPGPESVPFGRKFFSEAHASMSVPSTEK